MLATNNRVQLLSLIIENTEMTNPVMSCVSDVHALRRGRLRRCKYIDHIFQELFRLYSSKLVIKGPVRPGPCMIVGEERRSHKKVISLKHQR